MQNKIIWIGTKESDILHTNNFFINSITACGSGENGNLSFSTEKNKRINYNVNNPEYSEYLSEKMSKMLIDEPTVQFMYYNPYYAFLLNSSLTKSVCCLNPKPIIDLLRSKCEMRILASKYIPVVPFERVLGHDLNEVLKSEIKLSKKKFIIQDNISSGGEGTYIISNKDELPIISDNSTYLLSPYFEYNIPININFIIFDEDVIIFPPSIQIINRINGKLLFAGTDYQTEKFSAFMKEDIIFHTTLKLASVLKGLGYRGIGGFDYIFAEKQLLFLECNPRFQASSYLINLSLEKHNIPSMQELNFMAFNHEKAPDYDFYAMKIPYSCIAYSYHKYLNNSLIKKEWYTHPNVVEILEDGLKKNMVFVDDAYLYRIIFSKSITDITPESHLISYDNLLAASKEWYYKIISGDLLALKISLINQGVFISESAFYYIKLRGGIKDSVFDSIDVTLENGMVINCPYKINYADFSPFSLELLTNQLELFYYQERLGSISLEPPNLDEERLTQTKHIPYKKLSYVGGDRLRIHHTDICIFKRAKNSCRFCNLPVNGFDYTLEDFYEVIDFYLEKGGFRHILIGGGSEATSYESDTLLKLVKYIRSQTDMPIYLMCLPIEDKMILQDLFCAGVTEIGFNIEIWDDEIAKKIMPGKGSITRQRYLSALKSAKDIWKESSAVRSLLIVGLEKQTNLMEAVETLCSEGIMPILSIFRPLPNSQMSDFLPPSNDYLYRIYNQLDSICQKNNQHLGPECMFCQNNTLSLPW